MKREELEEVINFIFNEDHCCDPACIGDLAWCIKPLPLLTEIRKHFEDDLEDTVNPMPYSDRPDMGGKP